MCHELNLVGSVCSECRDFLLYLSDTSKNSMLLCAISGNKYHVLLAQFYNRKKLWHQGTIIFHTHEVFQIVCDFAFWVILTCVLHWYLNLA